MLSKKKIIIGIGILAVVGLVILSMAKLKNTYLYMPYEYQNSEIFWREWHELKKPLRLEICTFEGENKCVDSTDEEEIKYFIESFWELEHVSKSRKEIRELSFNEDYGKRYHVNIRHLERYSGGRYTGPNLFTIDVYDNQRYIKSPHGNYYYFELPEDVREFIFELVEREQNIS